MLDRHLRQKQTPPRPLYDYQPVLTGFDRWWRNRRHFREHRNFDLEAGDIGGIQGCESWIVQRGADGALHDRFGQGQAWIGAADAAA